MTVDEVEALRLADFVGQYQEEAGAAMRVSRATFGRIVQGARRKVADAIVHGKALRVEGGNVEMPEGDAVLLREAMVRSESLGADAVDLPPCCPHLHGKGAPLQGEALRRVAAECPLRARQLPVEARAGCSDPGPGRERVVLGNSITHRRTKEKHS